MKALSFYDLSEEKQRIAIEEIRKLFPRLVEDVYVLAEARSAVYIPPEVVVIRGDWVSMRYNPRQCPLECFCEPPGP